MAQTERSDGTPARVRYTIAQLPSEHSNPLNTRSPCWPPTGIAVPSSSRQHSNGPQKKKHRCGNRLKNTCRHSCTRLTQQVRSLVLRTAHQPSPCPSALSIFLHHLVLLKKFRKRQNAMGSGHVAPCAGRCAGSRQPGYARGSFFVRA